MPVILQNVEVYRKLLNSIIGLVNIILENNYLQIIELFNFILGNLPHKHKIIIAGNHELSFDRTFTHPFTTHSSGDRQKHMGTSILDNIPTLGMSKDTLAEAIKTTNIKDYLTNCVYLEDSEIVLYGIKIYGTPW